MYRLFCVALKALALASCGMTLAECALAAPMVWDDVPRRVLEYRAQQDGGVVMRVDSPVASSGCANSSVVYADLAIPAYRAISSLGFAAFASQKTVMLIYSGCSSTTGAVNLVGFIVLQ